jgi:hypothetical protein
MHTGSCPAGIHVPAYIACNASDDLTVGVLLLEGIAICKQ